MQLKLNLTLETVQDGQYYLKGTRLDFNLPYQIFIVKGDSHFKPYFRVHINYELAAIYYTEKQCENFLLKLTKEQAPYSKETVKAMKAAGFKIKEEKDGKDNVNTNYN